jgi:hypothetical protein
MTNSPAEAIAEDLVEFLNRKNDSIGEELGYLAECPCKDAEIRREYDGLLVQAIPYGEDEEKVSRGGVMITARVNLFISRPLDDEVDRKRMNAFSGAIRRALRFEGMAGATWQRTETIAMYSVEDVARWDLYESLFRIHYVKLE